MINNPSINKVDYAFPLMHSRGVIKNSQYNNDKSILKRGVSEPPQFPKQREELEGFLPERLEASEKFPHMGVIMANHPICSKPLCYFAGAGGNNGEVVIIK